MNTRRLAGFVESLRRNRRPKPFTPDADDVDAMRATIELNSAQPGAALPRAEFVNDLHRRLADQLDENHATVALDAARLSRRRVSAASARRPQPRQPWRWGSRRRP